MITEYKKIKNRQIVFYTLSAQIICAMLLISMVYDLQISQAIFRQNNFFSKLGMAIGKFPTFFLLALSFIILQLNLKKLNRKIHILYSILYFVASYICLFYYFYDAIDYGGVITAIIAIAMSGIAFALIFLFASAIDKDTLDKLVKFAIVTIISCAFIVIITQAVKMVWDRARFITMFEANNFDAFTKWYSLGDGGDSFPSGHTACWAAIICISAYFNTSKKLRTKKALFCYGALLSSLLIGFFRMLGGYHFMSDCAVAILISFFIFTAFELIFYGDKYENIYMRNNKKFESFIMKVLYLEPHNEQDESFKIDLYELIK